LFKDLGPILAAQRGGGVQRKPLVSQGICMERKCALFPKYFQYLAKTAPEVVIKST